MSLAQINTMLRSSLVSAGRFVRIAALRVPLSRFSGASAVSSRFVGPLQHRAYSVTTSGQKAPEQVEQLTTREYHRLTDEYLENLVDHLEELSEGFPQIDAEYSQGVLTLEMPPVGTYVINKQPPNKQIWISSPVSGPDRFDPLDGKWVSLRTKETLGDVLRREVSEALGEEILFEGCDD